ncbi:MAG: hypothetical protein JNN28_20865 [Saprospiraceae bacterium]|nr:hypothetical protein [Saprospiraceae bacterium]
MKKHYLFLGFLLAIFGCVKDDQINISGKIVNMKDNQPVGNITIIAGYYQFSDIWWEYKELASDMTSTKGKFELAFEEVHSGIFSSKPELHINSLGAAFQPGAKINGAFYKMLCLDHGFKDLEDNGYYLIELIPVTKAYFIKPNIPPGWEIDTLTLNIENIVLDPQSNGDVCEFDTTTFTLRLDNVHGWEDLQQVRNLHLGDELTVHYAISNGVLKKVGTFSKTCTIGDTTAVALAIW